MDEDVKCPFKARTICNKCELPSFHAPLFVLCEFSAFKHHTDKKKKNIYEKKHGKKQLSFSHIYIFVWKANEIEQAQAFVRHSDYSNNVALRSFLFSVFFFFFMFTKYFVHVILLHNCLYWCNTVKSSSAAEIVTIAL